jgi:hypothetical protein
MSKRHLISRAALAVVLVAGAIGVFFAGRATAHRGHAPASYRAGYLAGREDAFGSYDGGWGYGEPYVVVLRRASPQITYAFAQRWPMQPGLEYRVCGKTVCSRPSR